LQEATLRRRICARPLANLAAGPVAGLKRSTSYQSPNPHSIRSLARRANEPARRKGFRRAERCISRTCDYQCVFDLLSSLAGADGFRCRSAHPAEKPDRQNGNRRIGCELDQATVFDAVEGGTASDAPIRRSLRPAGDLWGGSRRRDSAAIHSDMLCLGAVRHLKATQRCSGVSASGCC
jgi:hypothetical protein